MKNRLFLSTLLLSNFLIYGCGSSSTSTPESTSVPTVQVNTEAEVSTAELVNNIRNEYQLPAMAGLLWKSGNIIESGAAGVRAINESTEVTSADKWHLGSITKSMTATLAARLVDLGLISWDSRIEDYFDVTNLNVATPYHQVTLIQLLANHGGIQPDLAQVPNWDSYRNDSRNITTQRKEFAEKLLQISSSNVGEYQYSNGGFIIAGAMLEFAAGQSWEELMEQELFTPLDIFDAGFGAPTDNFNLSQPQGHKLTNNQWNTYSPESIWADNPAVIGPAGTVHMSIDSLLKYALVHVQGWQGESSFVSQAGFNKLHKEFGNGYALGWFTQENIRSHAGSNLLWYAKLGWDAEQQLVGITVTNAGGDIADQATDSLMNKMLERNQ